MGYGAILLFSSEFLCQFIKQKYDLISKKQEMTITMR